MSKVKCLVCDTVLEANCGHEAECACENQTYVIDSGVCTKIGGVELDKIAVYRDYSCQFEVPAL